MCPVARPQGLQPVAGWMVPRGCSNAVPHSSPETRSPACSTASGSMSASKGRQGMGVDVDMIPPRLSKRQRRGRFLPTPNAGPPENRASRAPPCATTASRQRRSGDVLSRIREKNRRNTNERTDSPMLEERSTVIPLAPRLEWYAACDILRSSMSFDRSKSPTEATMSPKKRRKIYGVRREARRTRGWTRWFQEGMFDADSAGSIRLRSVLFGQKT